MDVGININEVFRRLYFSRDLSVHVCVRVCVYVGECAFPCVGVDSTSVLIFYRLLRSPRASYFNYYYYFNIAKDLIYHQVR